MFLNLPCLIFLYLDAPLSRAYDGRTTVTPTDQSKNDIGILSTNSFLVQQGAVLQQPLLSTPSLVSNEFFISTDDNAPTTSDPNSLFQFTVPSYDGNLNSRLEVPQATTPTSGLGHRVYTRPSPVNLESEFLDLNAVPSRQRFIGNYLMSGERDNATVADISRKLHSLTDEFKSKYYTISSN